MPGRGNNGNEGLKAEKCPVLRNREESERPELQSRERWQLRWVGVRTLKALSARPRSLGFICLSIEAIRGF